MIKIDTIDKPLKDSGERRSFGTGAVRDVTVGKGNFSLLNPMVQWRLAKHFQKGAEKYEPRNWEKGIKFSTYVDSAQRHMTSFLLGMEDEDHLIAWLWNVYCLIATEEMIKRGILPKDLNDLPDYKEKSKPYNFNDFAVYVKEPTPITFNSVIPISESYTEFSKEDVIVSKKKKRKVH